MIWCFKFFKGIPGREGPSGEKGDKGKFDILLLYQITYYYINIISFKSGDRGFPGVAGLDGFLGQPGVSILFLKKNIRTKFLELIGLEIMK